MKPTSAKHANMNPADGTGELKWAYLNQRHLIQQYC